MMEKAGEGEVESIDQVDSSIEILPELEQKMIDMIDIYDENPEEEKYLLSQYSPQTPVKTNSDDLLEPIIALQKSPLVVEL
jgi:hypothetical protein